MQVKVREKGQMTLPKEVRDEVGVAAGESLTVLVVDGEIRMRPVKGVVERTFGIFSKYAEASHGKSIAEILAAEDAAVERAIVEDWLETEKRSR